MEVKDPPLAFKDFAGDHENKQIIIIKWDKGFPGGVSSKEHACQCRKYKRRELNPWVGKSPWRRAWQPTPVFLPAESHGLVGYSSSTGSWRVRHNWSDLVPHKWDQRNDWSMHSMLWEGWEGVPNLFGDLEEASKSMTPEMRFWDMNGRSGRGRLP